MPEFDCIVVGAGPAGATALRELARRGVNACVLEKAHFPRYKPCGGGISALTSSQLDFEWEALIEGALHRVDLALRHAPPLRLEASKPFAHFVMRERFDALLLEQAIAAGGAFYPGHKVIDLRIEPGRVAVETDRATFYAPVVIGADGANSRVARSIGLFGRERGIAIEAEVQAPKEVLERFRDSAYLSFADPPWGYGWIFPKRERLSVGVGTFSQRRSGLKEAFHRLLKATGLEHLPMEVFGHPIPTGGRKRAYSRPHTLLAGDAAGLNDPLSGEGIAHAIRSGKLAANHAARALETGKFDFDAYDLDVFETIGSDLERARGIAAKLYAFPRLFFWLFEKSPSTLERYFLLVRGEATYQEVTEHLARQYLRFGLFRGSER